MPNGAHPVTETLDAGITGCGDLVLMIAKRVKGLAQGSVLHVVGYDRGAAQDIPAWCRMTQNTLLDQHVPADSSQPSHFYIQKGL
jgi:tRNA 2-thiouridine synthesizing protein A